MQSRWFIVVCMALVVLGRGVHCLYLDATLCARAATTPASTQPLSDPSESDPDESGCICKGAIFTTVALPAQAQPRGEQAPIAHCSISVTAANLDEPASIALVAPPPHPGRTVRALLASWRI